MQNDKQVIRHHIRTQRKKLTQQQQDDAAQAVCAHIAQHDRVKQAKTIALFQSFDGEIDTRPTIEYLWQNGKQVCLPVLHPFTPHQLLFLRYDPYTIMEKHAFGITQPKLDVRDIILLSQIDIIFTPLVAFDSHKNRLGMGGGYYDRLLPYCDRYHFYPMGLAHDCQHVETVPIERWDQPLPEIITPSQVWR